MTRTDYSQLPSSDISPFIASTFIQDGVRCWYQVDTDNRPYTSKSDLTLEQFKKLQNGETIEFVNAKKEAKTFKPIHPSQANSIEANMRHVAGLLCCVDIDNFTKVEPSQC
jgi:hypothetical protein